MPFKFGQYIGTALLCLTRVVAGLSTIEIRKLKRWSIRRLSSFHKHHPFPCKRCTLWCGILYHERCFRDPMATTLRPVSIPMPALVWQKMTLESGAGMLSEHYDFVFFVVTSFFSLGPVKSLPLSVLSFIVDAHQFQPFTQSLSVRGPLILLQMVWTTATHRLVITAAGHTGYTLDLPQTLHLLAR